jgi:hypothetical protein
LLVGKKREREVRGSLVGVENGVSEKKKTID